MKTVIEPKQKTRKNLEITHANILAEMKTQSKNKANQMDPPTILVCGYTGSGKTTLIQGICGKDVVSDDKIVAGVPGTMGFVYYKSPLINFWDSQGFEMGQTEKEFLTKSKGFIRERQDDPNVKNHVHLVWYCIQGSGRVCDCDIKLINETFSKSNVLVLVTKSDITKPEALEAIKKCLIEKGKVEEKNILAISEDDKLSLLKVVDRTIELLPDAYRDAFISAQIVDLVRKEKLAGKFIHGAAATAAVIGAVPIPISDAFLLAPVQIGMLIKLANIYSLDLNEATLMVMVTESAGISAAASLTKFFPGIGSLISATVAGSLTEAIGWIANSYLKSCYIAKIEGRIPPKFEFNTNEFMRIYKETKNRRG